MAREVIFTDVAREVIIQASQALRETSGTDASVANVDVEGDFKHAPCSASCMQRRRGLGQYSVYVETPA